MLQQEQLDVVPLRCNRNSSSYCPCSLTRSTKRCYRAAEPWKVCVRLPWGWLHVMGGGVGLPIKCVLPSEETNTFAAPRHKPTRVKAAPCFDRPHKEREALVNPPLVNSPEPPTPHLTLTLARGHVLCERSIRSFSPIVNKYASEHRPDRHVMHSVI